MRREAYGLGHIYLFSFFLPHANVCLNLPHHSKDAFFLFCVLQNKEEGFQLGGNLYKQKLQQTS